jgi:hypothetical protein
MGAKVLKSSGSYIGNWWQKEAAWHGVWYILFSLPDTVCAWGYEGETRKSGRIFRRIYMKDFK